MASSLPIEKAYALPQYANLDFAYTAIDAVYIWTRGGYQVARNPDDYPLYIAIEETDFDEWMQFFDRVEVPVAQERQPPADIEGAIQFVLEPRRAVTADVVDSRPVIPLEETIDFAYENYAHFQSALAMLDDMYEDIDLDAEY